MRNVAPSQLGDRKLFDFESLATLTTKGNQESGVSVWNQPDINVVNL